MTRTALADRDSDRWQIRTERAGPALGLGGAGGSDDPSQCRGRQRSRPSPTVNPATGRRAGVRVGWFRGTQACRPASLVGPESLRVRRTRCQPCQCNLRKAVRSVTLPVPCLRRQVTVRGPGPGGPTAGGVALSWSRRRPEAESGGPGPARSASSQAGRARAGSCRTPGPGAAAAAAAAVIPTRMAVAPCHGRTPSHWHPSLRRGAGR